MAKITKEEKELGMKVLDVVSKEKLMSDNPNDIIYGSSKSVDTSVK